MPKCPIKLCYAIGGIVGVNVNDMSLRDCVDMLFGKQLMFAYVMDVIGGMLSGSKKGSGKKGISSGGTPALALGNPEVSRVPEVSAALGNMFPGRKLFQGRSDASDTTKSAEQDTV